MSKSQLIPLNDTILVKRDDPEPQTEGGIVLPDTIQEVKKTGVVLAVGPGKVLGDGTRAPMDFEVGNKIIIGNKVAVVPYGDVDYLIIKENNVVAILTE